MEYLIFSIMFIFSTIFMSTGIVNIFQNNATKISKNYILIIGVICNFILQLFCLSLLFTNNEFKQKLNEKPKKFEKINIELYKEIK